MERTIILTKDGSHTIAIPEWDLTYHSRHGAIQESMHVFIRVGLEPLFTGNLREIKILEAGFGTGLNALLTFDQASGRGQKISYTAIDLHPLSEAEAAQLNYCTQLGKAELQTVFSKLHQAPWETRTEIHPLFTIKKIQANLEDVSLQEKFHIVYFDAFAPSAQPELWSIEIFRNFFDMMEPGGLLVTYCSKTEVRRAMQSAGFLVEKIPGPPGKREMSRALKPNNT